MDKQQDNKQDKNGNPKGKTKPSLFNPSFTNWTTQPCLNFTPTCSKDSESEIVKAFKSWTNDIYFVFTCFSVCVVVALYKIRSWMQLLASVREFEGTVVDIDCFQNASLKKYLKEPELLPDDNFFYKLAGLFNGLFNRPGDVNIEEKYRHDACVVTLEFKKRSALPFNEIDNNNNNNNMGTKKIVFRDIKITSPLKIGQTVLLQTSHLNMSSAPVFYLKMHQSIQDKISKEIYLCFIFSIVLGSSVAYMIKS